MKGFQAAKRQILFLLSLRLKGGEFKGFTLLELLVAMVVGSIIVFLMLTGVTSLMGTNQREAARSDTQRDTQAAIDYISRDLREAIYVYDGRCLSNSGANNNRVELVPATATTPATFCSAILNFLPAELNSTTQLPILAFWRVDPLPDPIKTFCRTNAKRWVEEKSSTSPLLDVPCASQTTYTLVAYTLDWSNPGNIWRGRARLKRYALPQYEYRAADATVSPNTPPPRVQGWVTPLDKEIGFPQWPLKTAPNGTIASAQGSRPTLGNSAAVLIDFMDDTVGSNVGSCPSSPPPPAPAPTAPAVVPQDEFTLSPTPALASGNREKRGFYACVRGTGASLNQEVIVRLQANAAGRPGVPKVGSSLPITMETRVLTRGVLNKGS